MSPTDTAQYLDFARRIAQRDNAGAWKHVLTADGERAILAACCTTMSVLPQ